MIAKSVKYLVSLHLHTNLHFEDQVKIAKLMSHSIFTFLFNIIIRLHKYDHQSQIDISIS